MQQKQFKGTPGPWEVRSMTTRYSDPVIEIKSTHQEGVLSYSQLGPLATVIGHSEESQADAKVIAAVPDLITALQALVERDDNGGMHDTWEMGRDGEPEMLQSPVLTQLLDAARAALDKAL